MIYLDSSATHPVLVAAFDEFHRALIDTPGNPNSSHKRGQAARELLEESRETMLTLLGAENGDRLIFTSGASESAAMAIKTLIDNCFTISENRTEHHCVSQYPFPKSIGDNQRRGIIQMLFQNENGKIYSPIEPQENTLWACDISAGVGHVPFAFRDYPAMTYAFGSAQKFGGVPGVGFLLVKRGAPLSQLIYGAPERGGTPPVALVSAMTTALKLKMQYIDETIDEITKCRDILTSTLAKIPNMHFNCEQKAGENQLAHILNVSFDGVDGKTLALLLSNRDIMVSAGAACTSNDAQPSHVIAALYGEDRARSAIRISLCCENTPMECGKAAKEIADCVEQLRKLS